MSSIGWISFYFVILLLFSKISCEFPTDFLGSFISDNEYNNRTFCWTQVCMADAGRLIYSAYHNSNKTTPCDDFKTFAMGEFFEHRVLNDRYPSLGFQLDVELQFWEKQKRMMLKPIKQSDPKIFKIIKSFFRKCINDSKTFSKLDDHIILIIFFKGLWKIKAHRKLLTTLAE